MKEGSLLIPFVSSFHPLHNTIHSVLMTIFHNTTSYLFLARLCVLDESRDSFGCFVRICRGDSNRILLASSPFPQPFQPVSNRSNPLCNRCTTPPTPSSSTLPPIPYAPSLTSTSLNSLSETWHPMTRFVPPLMLRFNTATNGNSPITCMFTMPLKPTFKGCTTPTTLCTSCRFLTVHRTRCRVLCSTHFGRLARTGCRVNGRGICLCR